METLGFHLDPTLSIFKNRSHWWTLGHNVSISILLRDSAETTSGGVGLQTFPNAGDLACCIVCTRAAEFLPHTLLNDHVIKKH